MSLSDKEKCTKCGNNFYSLAYMFIAKCPPTCNTCLSLDVPDTQASAKYSKRPDTTQ